MSSSVRIHESLANSSEIIVRRQLQSLIIAEVLVEERQTDAVEVLAVLAVRDGHDVEEDDEHRQHRRGDQQRHDHDQDAHGARVSMRFAAANG